MTDELDPIERRLARQLADFAETPFPAREPLDQVAARAAAAGRANASRTRVGALLAAAAVVVTVAVAIGALAGPDLLQPAATPTPAPTPVTTSQGVGFLHVTADETSDHPHDALDLQYVLADGSIGGSDAVPAETTVFVDAALPAGTVRVLANGKECSGTLTIEAGRETDAVFSGLYEEACTVTASGSHLPDNIVHPEPRTALGAFVVVDSVLVVRPLDPGSTTGLIRKPADDIAEVRDFDIPPGRYELALEVAGKVLKTLEIELERGQEFWFNVRALAPSVPIDCGDVVIADCHAAAAAAYAQGYGPSNTATFHVVSVRVQASKDQGGCVPNADRVFDVRFGVREDPYSIEDTVAHHVSGMEWAGGMELCTY
jgi:hypothetical protein